MRKRKTALKMLFIVGLLSLSIFAASTQIKADTDVNSFNEWRPWFVECGGCHSGVTNYHAAGSVEFQTPAIVVPGQQFQIRLRVVGFIDASDSALSLGLNILDLDNGDFLTATIAEANHGVDPSGDSLDWTQAFTLTAPNTPGTYVLRAYGVDGLGTTSTWAWVTNDVIVTVSPGAQSSLSYYIEGGAEYLMNSGVSDSGGYKWSEYNSTSAKFKTAYLKGTAGIGEMYLELYESAKTDPFFVGVAPNAETYLNMAKGAAAWIQARAIPENGGYKWPRDLNDDNSIAGTSANYTGMYDGAAGIGTFFLDMYRATGDSSYLTYAEGAAIWIESVANKSVGLRFFEHDGQDSSTQLSTRWTYGSPGIGGFFVDLFLATGDATYAGWANQTAEGLIYNALIDEGGYSWTRYNGNTERYVGRWHGAAGTAMFFVEMYDLYANATYLQYAEGIATWIHSTHEEDQGYFYPDNNAAGTKSYKLGGWSRSPAGIGSMFIRLYHVTEDQTYLNYVTEIADFLYHNTTLSNGGFSWADTDTNPRIAAAIGHGLAGTGMFFVEAFQATGNPQYSAIIQGISQTLGDTVVMTSEGLAWTQSDLTSDVHMGLYYGVAGVAKFLNLVAHSGIPHIDEIDDTIDYLTSTAVDDAGGLKWAEFNGTAAKYKTTYLKGTAGIASYFLQLYQQRHGEHFFAGIMPSANDYLDVAEDAATWIIAQAIPENGGYKWPRDLNTDNSIAGSSANYTGMYDGAAGIGTLFLDLYRTTGDSSYLTYAEGAAVWIESVANKSYGMRYFEHDGQDSSTQLSTRWTYGSPGIGGFFVNLYLATGDTTYAGWANQTAEGLIYNALTDEGGYSWTRYNGNTERYVGRWHGAAGTATFFTEMYDLTGNSTFLDYAEGTADWIFATHSEDQGDFYPDNNATDTKSYKLGGWSRSPAGIGDFFGRLFQSTSDPTYLAYMTRALDFLVNNATVAEGGLVWADTDTNPRIARAIGHGLAGTGHFMLDGYRLNHNHAYFQTIDAIITALSNMAYPEANGASWTQSDLTSDVHMGLYYGVAGVGQFLLRAESSYPMMDFDAPIVSSPDDLDLEVDDVAQIQWTITDLFPGDWVVEIDSTVDSQSPTFDSGDVVTEVVDTSVAGTFTYTITVTDFFGRSSSDTVSVIVSDVTTTPTTTPTSPTTTGPSPGPIPFEFQVALWGSIGLNVLLVVIVVITRTRSRR
ncbi:MAG: lanthionine synthetase LanC family protein [Candidatus Thorarchaeota archaeon]